MILMRTTGGGMTCPHCTDEGLPRELWLFGHCGMSRPSCYSVTNLCPSVTPRTAALQASLSFTISKNLLRFMSIELVMLSNHLI